MPSSIKIPELWHFPMSRRWMTLVDARRLRLIGLDSDERGVSKVVLSIESKFRVYAQEVLRHSVHHSLPGSHSLLYNPADALMSQSSIYDANVES